MKYIVCCFVFVLGVLQCNSFLAANLQNDLARLDVELTSLSKMIPVGKRPMPETPKQGVFEGVRKRVGEFFEGAKKFVGFGPQEEIKEVSFDDAKKYWPANTKIKIGNEFKNIDNGIQSLQSEGKKSIPAGIIIQVPGYDKVELEIGKKGYAIWKNMNFYPGSSQALMDGLVFFDKEDIEEFPEGTKIYIKTEEREAVEFVVTKDMNLDSYLDEQDRLLGIIKVIDVGDNEYNFIGFVNLPKKKESITQIIEAGEDE